MAGTNSFLVLESGTFELNEGCSFDGSGVTRLSYGTFSGNGTLSVSGTAEIAGGMLTGNHTWSGTGRLDWTAGGFDGSGTTTFASDFAVHILGFSDKFLSYHSITNQGVIIWNSAGELSGFAEGQFHNGGIFILGSNCNMGGSGTFNNVGIITTPENAFSSLSSDTWNFRSSGSFLAEMNSVLVLESGTFELHDGCTFAGPGLTRLSYGTFFGSGTLSVNGIVEISGGMLTGNHTWTGTGRLDWVSGGFDGTGSTLFGPDFDIQVVGFSDKFLSYHSITNQGVLTWNSVGELNGFAEGVFRNEGHFILGSNCSLDGSGTFNNAGTISAAENAFSAFSADTWTFRNSGSFLAGMNSVLVLESGTFELNEGSSFDGSGLTRLSFGTFPGIGTLTVNGRAELAGGMMTGEHAWDGSGQLDWTGGGFDGFGTTTFAPDFNVQVSGLSDKYLTYHSVTNKGIVTWNGGGNLYGLAEGQFHNAGTFVLGNNCSFSGSGTFDNTGTIKTAENTFAVLSADTWTFRSSGSLMAEMDSFLSLESGTFELNEGCSFDGAGLTRLWSGTFSGSGTLTLNATVELFGGMVTGDHLWTGPGQLNWLGGGFEGTGTNTFAADFDVNVTHVNTKYISSQTIRNYGTVAWGGQLSGMNAVLENYGTFTVQSDWTLEGTGSFNNHGSIYQTSGTLALGWVFQNDGLIAMEGGAFNIAGDYTPAPGAVHEFVLHNASPISGYGQLSSDACNFAGTLNVALGEDFSGADTDSFQLMNYNGYTGGFSDIYLPDSSWQHEYRATGFVVTKSENVAPTISVPLEDQTVDSGDNVDLFVVVAGTEPLSYQWQFESQDIPGATTNVLILTNVTSASAGVYSVVVTNVAGSASSSAVLTVRQAPLIVSHPENQTVTLTSNATFSVVATGDGPLSYQWFFNNTVLSGATGSSFSHTSVTSSDAGDYFVIVSNTVGSITSQVATLTISYQENPFLKAAGRYNGLFYETNEVRFESAGFFTMNVRTNTAFSGKMLLDGNAVSFSGKFAANGATNKTVLRTKFGKTPLTLQLQLDFGADQVFGTISSSNWISALLADRLVFHNTNLLATNFSGKYTALIPGAEDPSLAPVGYGYGLVTVRTNGRVAWSGLTADRQTAKQSTFIASNGSWPFFAPLYKGISTFHDGSKWITNKDTKGSLIGWLTVTNAPIGALNGTVNWTKKAWTNQLYSIGFTNESDIVGSVFTPITKFNKGTRLLSMTNGIASFFAGDLSADVTHSFTLRTNNTFLTTSLTNLKMTVSASSGVLRGSFRDPASNTLVPFYGAIVQEQNFGGGFFLGTNQSGLMLLEGELP